MKIATSILALAATAGLALLALTTRRDTEVVESAQTTDLQVPGERPDSPPTIIDEWFV